jgi:lysozyme family protein
MAVNSGPGNAVKTLQRMLGVAVDGDIGTKTISAVGKWPAAKYDQFLTLRREFYDNIVKRDPGQKRFLSGWHNRLDRLRTAAIDT